MSVCVCVCVCVSQCDYILTELGSSISRQKEVTGGGPGGMVQWRVRV